VRSLPATVLGPLGSNIGKPMSRPHINDNRCFVSDHNVEWMHVYAYSTETATLKTIAAYNDGG